MCCLMVSSKGQDSFLAHRFRTPHPQVYVFCCAHAEQVKEHLKAAGWLQERASITVKVGCTSHRPPSP